MNSVSLKWLLDEWAEAMGRTLQSVSDVRPAITWKPVALTDEILGAKGTLNLEILFSLSAESILWIGVPFEALNEVGLLTLRAAGVENSEEGEIRSTCLETIQQSTGAISAAISSRLQQRISAQQREVDTVPPGQEAFRFDFVYQDSASFVAYAFPSMELLEKLHAPEINEPEDQDEPGTENFFDTEKSTVNPANSKTFEILLDVSLPLSVSFGRTEMLIKDVLKLTTGSIVELNRTASEPVDVIVNDCIIARGEVVVVDGNYGVRIQRIASRQERLRSSGQSLASIGKPDLTVLDD